MLRTERIYRTLLELRTLILTCRSEDELPSTETVWNRKFLEFLAVAPITTVSETLLYSASRCNTLSPRLKKDPLLFCKIDYTSLITFGTVTI